VVVPDLMYGNACRMASVSSGASTAPEKAILPFKKKDGTPLTRSDLYRASSCSTSARPSSRASSRSTFGAGMPPWPGVRAGLVGAEVVLRFTHRRFPRYGWAAPRLAASSEYVGSVASHFTSPDGP
jgi:hypothetical protein